MNIEYCKYCDSYAQKPDSEWGICVTHDREMSQFNWCNEFKSDKGECGKRILILIVRFAEEYLIGMMMNIRKKTRTNICGEMVNISSVCSGLILPLMSSVERRT